MIKYNMNISQVDSASWTPCKLNNNNDNLTVMLEASESVSFKLFRFDDVRRCNVSSTGLKIKRNMGMITSTNNKPQTFQLIVLYKIKNEKRKWCKMALKIFLSIYW